MFKIKNVVIGFAILTLSLAQMPVTVQAVLVGVQPNPVVDAAILQAFQAAQFPNSVPNQASMVAPLMVAAEQQLIANQAALGITVSAADAGAAVQLQVPIVAAAAGSTVSPQTLIYLNMATAAINQNVGLPQPAIPYMVTGPGLVAVPVNLPILNAADQAAIGLPACYPTCLPAFVKPPPLGGLVTPTGGKGVKFAGTSIKTAPAYKFQVVSAAGQIPVVIQVSAGTAKIKTQLITVPNGLLLAPALGPLQGGFYLFPGAPTTAVANAPTAAAAKVAGKGVKPAAAVTPAGTVVTPVVKAAGKGIKPAAVATVAANAPAAPVIAVKGGAANPVQKGVQKGIFNPNTTIPTTGKQVGLPAGFTAAQINALNHGATPAQVGIVPGAVQPVGPQLTPVAGGTLIGVRRGGPGYAIPGEVILPQSRMGKDNNAQAEKQLNEKEVDEIQTEATEKDNQGNEMESRGHDMNQDMDRSLEVGHGMDGVRDQDKGSGSSGSTGSGSDGGGTNSGGGSNSGKGSSGGHGDASNGGVHGGH